MNFANKQTIKRFLIGIGGLGLVLTPFETVARAEILPLKHQRMTVKSDAYTSRRLLTQANSDEFVRYDSEKFSVDYPRGWQVSPQGDDSIAIVGIFDGVTMPIHTDVVVLREDPQTTVPQRLDAIVAEAVAVQGYSLVNVDGQSGIRIWYQPADDQLALVTFVGYGNQQTVVLTSRYEQNTDAELLVTQIHESFVNHSVAQAITPNTPD